MKARPTTKPKEQPKKTQSDLPKEIPEEEKLDREYLEAINSPNEYVITPCCQIPTTRDNFVKSVKEANKGKMQEDNTYIRCYLCDKMPKLDVYLEPFSPEERKEIITYCLKPKEKKIDPTSMDDNIYALPPADIPHAMFKKGKEHEGQKQKKQEEKKLMNYVGPVGQLAGRIIDNFVPKRGIKKAVTKKWDIIQCIHCGQIKQSLKVYGCKHLIICYTCLKRKDIVYPYYVQGDKTRYMDYCPECKKALSIDGLEALNKFLPEDAPQYKHGSR